MVIIDLGETKMWSSLVDLHPGRLGNKMHSLLSDDILKFSSLHFLHTEMCLLV